MESIKHELQYLIQGKSGHSYDSLIQATSRHLRRGEKAGPMAARKFQNKAQEAARLLNYAESQGLIVSSMADEDFISKGAEQRVYLKKH